jgi:hypothetical protein
MDDSTLAAFHRLVECLEDASRCITQLTRDQEHKHVHPQLDSLKLVLDNNAEVLRLKIAEARAPSRSRLYIVSGGHT